MCVYVCVRACVCVRARVRARMRALSGRVLQPCDKTLVLIHGLLRSETTIFTLRYGCAKCVLAKVHLTIHTNLGHLVLFCHVYLAHCFVS